MVRYASGDFSARMCQNYAAGNCPYVATGDCTAPLVSAVVPGRTPTER